MLTAGPSATVARVGLPRESGYFPAGESVLRRVHGERAVGLLYGQRALLMQATDPLAFTGLIGSTGGLHAPFERLPRPAPLVGEGYFRSGAEGGPVGAPGPAGHAPGARGR